MTARSRTSHGSTFMPGEPMKWPTKVWRGRSNSSTGEPICTTVPSCITTTLSAKVKRLGLVVRDIDHRARDALVQLLQLGAQLPLQMRIDHGQRLVEHDDIDVGANQPAAERDLLLAVRGQAGGAPPQRALQIEHAGDLVDLRVDLGLGQAAIAQRKRQIVVDRHGVVDDRKLEHLRDLALVGRHVGQVDVVEQDAAFGRPHQAGNDVEQGRLAAAGGPEQRIGAAVLPLDVELLQRPVRRRLRGFAR